MRIQAFELDDTVNGVPELWGLSPLLHDYLELRDPKQREKAADAMAMHQSPIGQFMGGSALVDLASRTIRYGDHKRDQLFRRGDEAMLQAHSALAAEERHIGYVVRAALEIADIPARYAMHVEHRQLTAVEQQPQHDTTRDYL